MCEASSPLIHLPDQQDNQGESLELKGYLFKKGRTTRRSWKRRYFLLKRYTREHALLSEEKTESTEWVLEYFSDEEKSNQPCKLKRKMPLKGAEVFIPREISLQNNRVHEFSVTPGKISQAFFFFFSFKTNKTY